MADSGSLVEKWYDIEKFTGQLADKIEAHCSETGESFDRLALISLGSFGVAAMLAERFGFDETRIVNMGMTKTPPRTAAEQPFSYGQMPTAEDVSGKKFLVIDEVWRSGRTMSHAKERLQSLGASLVRCGVLHYIRPQQGQPADGYVPDWCAWPVDDNSPIVYPRKRQQIPLGGSVVRRPDPQEPEESFGVIFPQTSSYSPPERLG